MLPVFVGEQDLYTVKPPLPQPIVDNVAVKVSILSALLFLGITVIYSRQCHEGKRCIF